MDYRVTDEALTQSANSIRTKSGSSAPIPWDNLTGFKSAIDSIQTGSNITVEETLVSGEDYELELDDNGSGGGGSSDITEIVLGSYHTDSASGAIAAFDDGAENIPVKDLTISIEPVQSGSDDPSPTNVRAISGWTGANAVRAGKNLLLKAVSKTHKGVQFTANTDGSVTISGTATDTAILDIARDSLWLKRGTYYASISGSNATCTIFKIVNGTASVLRNGIGTFSLVEDTQVFMRLSLSSGTTASGTAYPQIELGSAATDYEPYQGEIYNITFPSEAGAVYGGTLDVTNGLLTVDRVMITIDGSDDSRLASFNTTATNVNRVQSNIYNDIGVENIAFDACDRFEPIAPTTTPSLYKVWNSTTAPRMFFGLPKTVTTLDEAKAWFASNPTHVVARIASSQTYQLTSIEVLTLLGANTISDDCGDVSVTYRADPTLAAFVQDVQID